MSTALTEYDIAPEIGPGPGFIGFGTSLELQNTVTEDKDTQKTYFGYTRAQFVTAIILAIVYFFSSCIVSLQAPFYPKEAEAKGASATEYGLVQGSFNLVMFIMSPVFGIILGFTSPKLVFIIGIFVPAVGSIMFGFLQYIQDHVTFITLSFLLRIVQATGDSAFVTASFTIVALQFPESVGTTFASLETFWGLGLLAGPGIGGALYQVGGFILPFLVMGACFFIIGIISYFVLPDLEPPVKNTETEFNSENEKRGVMWLIGIPEVSLAFLSVLTTASSVGFLISTLEPHLRDSFGLTPAVTGLVFMIDGGMYAIFAPLWGKVCDNHSQPKMFTIIGALLTFSGFLLIGPAPFIPLPTVLWLTCVGLVIHGLGTGASYVSGFIQALRSPVENGMPDDVATYGLVSGLFMSSLCLGLFLGSSIGGVLLDNYGFKFSTIYVLASQFLIVFLNILFIFKLTKFKLRPAPAVGPDKEKIFLKIKSTDYGAI